MEKKEKHLILKYGFLNIAAIFLIQILVDTYSTIALVDKFQASKTQQKIYCNIFPLMLNYKKHKIAQKI